MAHQVIWTSPILEEFATLANLTDEEYWIMETRIQGMTRVQQCMKLNVSLSTLDRAIRRIKKKYDVAQAMSDTLPPRRFSAAELYMDTH